MIYAEERTKTQFRLLGIIPAFVGAVALSKGIQLGSIVLILSGAVFLGLAISIFLGSKSRYIDTEKGAVVSRLDLLWFKKESNISFAMYSHLAVVEVTCNVSNDGCKERQWGVNLVGKYLASDHSGFNITVPIKQFSSSNGGREAAADYATCVAENTPFSVKMA